MSPPAVRLDVPERRRDPIIERTDHSRSVGRSNGSDPAVAHLELEPLRIAKIASDDSQWESSSIDRRNSLNDSRRAPTDPPRFGWRPVAGARRR